jgi:maltooligosyltrehalose trehalohydrolase
MIEPLLVAPPVGACYRPGEGVEFRVWAPAHASIELLIGSTRHLLRPDDSGHWTVSVPDARPGTHYQYVLDGKDTYADPASRYQPHGPDGVSEVIDPLAFDWRDAAWRGAGMPGQVIYELHVGTFTEAGTWRAAASKLPHLRDLGITAVEMMPVADFPGQFGWGYDGVCWYAPYHGYGRPDDLRAFVDAAHGIGIAVLLDVVYNHLGQIGNHLEAFTPHYFSSKKTDWGRALNYDGPQARAVREFACANAEHWIRDYHFDGLRLDATQSIFDQSDEHILTELTRRARSAAAGRSIIVIAESEPQTSELLTSAAEGGRGLDAVWNDDFHHSAVVALQGTREAYYTDYLGRAHEFVAAAKYGYLYQGQYYVWQDKRRGAPTLGQAPYRFVSYLENHDQVANSADGTRLWQRSQPGAHRAMTALLLLGPWTPLLFQGQEWSSTRLFTFFADFQGDFARDVKQGRLKSLSEFPALASGAVRERVPDPAASSTFQACRLDWAEPANTLAGRRSHTLHRDLLHLRHDDAVVRAGVRTEVVCAPAVLNDHCLLLRYFGPDRDDRLLIVNLGPELYFRPAPEPLLAPAPNSIWSRRFCSDDPKYGGQGVREDSPDARGWIIPAYSATLFASASHSEPLEGGPQNPA